MISSCPVPREILSRTTILEKVASTINEMSTDRMMNMNVRCHRRCLWLCQGGKHAYPAENYRIKTTYYLQGFVQAISLLLQKLYKPEHAKPFHNVLCNLKTNVVLRNFVQYLR